MNLPPWDGDATDVETCELLAALVRLQKPQCVVEAGTHLGHAAIYMTDALRRNGMGHLHTCDPRNTHRLADPDRVTYHQEDFVTMLGHVPPPDFAFIDASADEPGGARLRWQHFMAVKDRLNPGGMICVHDTLSDSWDDGNDGFSAAHIRAECALNLRGGRGLSLYYA